jgi:hypothetical protein
MRIGSASRPEQVADGDIGAHPGLLGIGPDDQAADSDTGDRFEAIGEGRVAVYDGRDHGSRRDFFPAAGDRFDPKCRACADTPPA